MSRDARSRAILRPPFQNKRSGGEPTSRRDDSVRSDSTTAPLAVKTPPRRGPQHRLLVKAHSLSLDEGSHVTRRAVDGDGDPIAGTACLDLDGSFSDALLAHDDLVRPTDAVRVGELNARAFVTVVEDDVKTDRRALAPDALGDRRDHIVADGERQDRDLQRSDGHRPRDAGLVAVLLDDGRERPRDANAVAAHEEGLFDARFVRECGAHRLRVARSKLEDLADLD